MSIILIYFETGRNPPMNDLINTLLECPNLSLRILDASTGRTLTTITAEQLHRYTQSESGVCNKDCDNQACLNRPQQDKF